MNIPEKVKKIFTKERLIVLAIIAILGLVIWIMGARYNKVYQQYDNAMQNNKAYSSLLDKEKNKSNVFQVTIEQLEYYNDSITQKLIEEKNNLKIKDKEIRELNYLSTTISRTDTLVLVDTIFKEPDFCLDTTVGDQWANTHIKLEYPNTVEVAPKVKSEKIVTVYTKKETVDPPKKFFLFRWFQKKHTVCKVIVTEKNPYITDEQNVFFNISK